MAGTKSALNLSEVPGHVSDSLPTPFKLLGFVPNLLFQIITYGLYSTWTCPKSIIPDLKCPNMIHQPQPFKVSGQLLSIQKYPDRSQINLYPLQIDRSWPESVLTPSEVPLFCPNNTNPLQNGRKCIKSGFTPSRVLKRVKS